MLQAAPGGTLRHAPTGIHLDDANFVEPDIFWVREGSKRCRLVDGKYWRGAPDLIAEIRSPSKAARDRGGKFDLYQKHGVHEYWLVDPETPFVEVYVLKDGTFARLGLYQKGETFDSPTLKAVEVDTLFR